MLLGEIVHIQTEVSANVTAAPGESFRCYYIVNRGTCMRAHHWGEGMRKEFLTGICVLAFLADDAHSEVTNVHADEQIGTVRQVYDG